MRTYKPTKVPDDPKDLPAWLVQEFLRIQTAANAAEPYLVLQAMKVPPTKALLGVFAGAGAPTFAAAQSSVYLRTDGSSTSTRIYVNTDGSTGWTSVTTAS